jgi:hypothetical protein
VVKESVLMKANFAGIKKGDLAVSSTAGHISHRLDRRHTMNARKRSLIQLALFSLILPGCTTKALYEDYRYQEEVSEILLSTDGKNIVFLGREFHYIMEAPATILSLTQSTLSQKIITRFGDFFVNEKNELHGTVEMTTMDTLSDHEFDLASSLGFRVLMGKIMRLELTVTGKRYTSNNIINPATNKYKLNKNQTISISAKPSSLENALKAPLTPITLAADGVLTLLTVALIPFVFLSIVLHQQK